MRILHTSDWHLGRSFHREDLLGHQGVFVDHLLDVVEPSGSTWSSSPATSTTGPCPTSTPCTSPTRRSPGCRRRGRAWWSRAATTTPPSASASAPASSTPPASSSAPSAATVGTPVLLEDEHGPVAIHGLPYLDPPRPRRAVAAGRAGPTRRHSTRRCSGSGPTSPRGAAAPARSCWRTPSSPAPSPRTPSATSASAASRGSPRRRSTGSTTSPWATSTGDTPSTEPVRYSGSPLAYSFSEADQRKGQLARRSRRTRRHRRRLRRGSGPPPARPHLR